MKVQAQKVAILIESGKVVARGNLLGDVRNMSAIYTDPHVVADGDLVTGRTSDDCKIFARTIIDMMAKQ